MNKKHQRLKQIQENMKQKDQLNKGEENHYRMYWDYTSYYSNKLRSYLNYKEIPYKLMQTTLDDYQRLIPKLVGMPIIPVVLTPDDQVMQDSTPMMEWFEKEYSHKSAIPKDQRLAFIMWAIEEFSDEYLVRFAMRTRWGAEGGQNTLSARIARGFTYGQQSEMIKMGSKMILSRQSGFNEALGLATEEECKSVDQQYLDMLAILDKHLSDYSYLLGDRPSLADFAFFGPLWAHGFNDPDSAQILEVNAPQVCNWLQEMANLGDSRGGLGRTDFGGWIDIDGGVPESLIELLSFINKTYLPQAKGYRHAMLNSDSSIKVDIYGTQSQIPAWNYRAGTYAQLQKRFTLLNVQQQEWLENALTPSGLLPALMEGGIHENPQFEGLTAPFVTNPALNKLAYKGDKPLS